MEPQGIRLDGEGRTKVQHEKEIISSVRPPCHESLQRMSFFNIRRSEFYEKMMVSRFFTRGSMFMLVLVLMVAPFCS